MESSVSPFALTKSPAGSVRHDSIYYAHNGRSHEATARMRFAAGEIVKGTIIEVRPKEVLVDIGYKSEGVISGNEFEDIKAVKVGDEIDVLIEKLEDKDGMVVLSKEKAEFKKNWERILTICNEGGTITGKVKAVVKGGLLVNIGVEAFLPASQIDIIPPKNLDQLRRQHLRFQGRQNQPGAPEHRSLPPRTDRAGTQRNAARSCSPK